MAPKTVAPKAATAPKHRKSRAKKKEPVQDAPSSDVEVLGKSQRSQINWVKNPQWTDLLVDAGILRRQAVDSKVIENGGEEHCEDGGGRTQERRHLSASTYSRTINDSAQPPSGMAARNGRNPCHQWDDRVERWMAKAEGLAVALIPKRVSTSL
ncbi:hypothetical protein B0H13DRAFT_1883605 [Mycena leptocephala]|nr:hypothetical protein B0H13DRAFT_1883605 [Mycena leptocephala]